jgi:hypothetical protein
MQWTNLLDKFSTDLQRTLSTDQSSLIDEAKLDTTFLGMLACFGYLMYRVGGQKLLKRIVPDQKNAALWLVATNICFAFVIATPLATYRFDKKLVKYFDSTYFVASLLLGKMLPLGNKKRHFSFLIAAFTVLCVIRTSITSQMHSVSQAVLYTACVVCLNLWLDEFNMCISPYFAMLQNHLIVLVAYWVRYIYGNQNNPIFKAFDGCTWYASALLLALVIFFPEMESKTTYSKKKDDADDDLKILPKSFHGERAYMYLLTGWFFLAPVYLGWWTANPLVYLCVGWERITSTLTRCLLDHLRSQVRYVHGSNVGVYFDIFLDSSRVLAMFHIVESVNKKGSPVGFVPATTLVICWVLVAPFVMKMYGKLVRSLTVKED